MLAFAFLLVLAMLAFRNAKAGTLDQWLSSKFLNSAAPTPTTSSPAPPTITPAAPAHGGTLGDNSPLFGKS